MRKEKTIWQEKLSQPFSVTEEKTKRWLFLAITVLYLTYFFRGLRSVWSYGYFNYTNNWIHGFIPRGFWGTILRLLCGNHVPSTPMLTLLQYGIGLAFGGYICFVLYRLIYRSGNLAAFLIFAIFSTSTFNMFYMTEVGFLDHVIYLLVILHIEICLHADWRKGLVAGALLSVVFPWILETSAFLMCPVVASICAIRMMEEKELSFQFVCVRLLLAFLPTLAGIVVYRNMTVHESSVNALMQEMHGRAFFDSGYLSYASLWGDINLGNIVPQCWVYIPPEVVVYAAVVIGLLAFFLMNTKCSVRTMLSAVLLLIATSIVSYLAIYFGADYHRYYFSVVQAPMLIGIYLLQRHRSEHLTRMQGVLAGVVCLLIILPIWDYRLWCWNQIYKDFWFESLFQRWGILG